jgi:CRISPR-associated protein Csh2
MSRESELVDKNSEILFIYEASLCNPNGDPDEENRPRIDVQTRRNLVTDVRLKRFFRDYIVKKYGTDYIWVTKISGQSVRADTRLEALTKNRDFKSVKEVVMSNCIDARLFGATVPIGGEKSGARGVSISITGPVQFAWGYSLHPVEIVESSTITSVFSGREAGEEYGTMGKDFRLYYSLLAFYGVVSGNRASDAYTKWFDIEVLDHLLYQSLKLEATTRSKIGENPLVYMRIEYNDSETLIGDLRRFIKVDQEKGRPIRSLADLRVNLEDLTEKLDGFVDKINKIYLWEDDSFKDIVKGLEEKLAAKIQKIPYVEKMDLPNKLKLISKPK